MKLTTYQSTGGWFTEDGNILLDENSNPVVGWSGKGEGKNNPAMQDVHEVGPLPCGTYRICPWEEEHDHLGHLVAFLKPYPDNEMFGRDAFFIHGPSATHYGQESKGCCVVPHIGRVAIMNSGADTLEVVA